jgi:hypothetical protein
MGKRRTERIVLDSVVHLPRNKFSPKLTDDMRDRILEESRIGRSARKIAKGIAVHHETVCRFLRQQMNTTHSSNGRTLPSQGGNVGLTPS